MATLAITNPTVQTTAAGSTTPAMDWSSVHAVAVIQLKSVSGSPDSQGVQLQGSIDGSNFYNIGAAVTTVGNMVTVTTLAFRYTQVTVTASGGSSPTATVAVGVGP